MSSAIQTARALLKGNPLGGFQADRCGLLKSGLTRPDPHFSSCGLTRRTHRPARTLLLIYFLLLFFFGLTAQALAVPPGTVINNTAQASFRIWDSDSSTSSNTAGLTTTWIRTSAHIDLLQYAPTLGTAEQVGVPYAAYSADGTTGGVTQSVAAIYPAGGSTVIDLSQPIALAPAIIYHQGEPLFFRVNDADQNMDPLSAETVWILVSTPDLGDSELLLLTETGPDSGVFVGYLPSSGLGPLQAYNGVLDVTEGTRVTVQYNDPADPADAVSASALVDPYGVAFDSATGLPVDHVSLTLVQAAGGAPAVVYGDDGISSFPAAVTTGGTFIDSSGKVYAFPAGTYRFPFVAPGAYRLVIQPPAGYAAPSSAPSAVLQNLPGAPFALAEPGSRGEPFVLNPGPALRIDIPVDPTAAGLWVHKSADREAAAVGDFVQYTVALANGSGGTAAEVSITDRLPPGLRYRRGSARLDGGPQTDPTTSSDGRSLIFDIGDMAEGRTSQLRYVIEIAAGAKTGKAKNSARAAAAGGLTSNTASATITVTEDLLRSKNFVVGRVIAGNCGDESSPAADGVPGVRLYLEDGTFVITDAQGMYHFEGVATGTHVLQLDLQSLPDHLEITACEKNTRAAGSAFSRFVDLQGGTLWRQDFHVKAKPPPTGEAALQLICDYKNSVAAYEAEIGVRAVTLGNVRLSVILPDGARYLPGSSLVSGRSIDDPQIMDQVLIFRLGDIPAGQSRSVRFEVTLGGAVPGRLHTRALLTFDTPDQKNQRTPPIQTVLALSERVTREVQAPIVVRPHFENYSDVLLPADREMLDRLAERLSALEIEDVAVTGHSDDLPIRPSPQQAFADNQALSLARARRVADYLSAKLNLDNTRIAVNGRGDTAPVASNTTEEGRALNRRVEVSVSAVKVHLFHDIASIQCEDRKSAATQGRREIRSTRQTLETAPIQDFARLDLEILSPGFKWLMPAADYYPPIPSLKLAVGHGPGETIELRLNGRAVNPFHFDGVRSNRSATVSVSYWRGVDLRDGQNVFTAIRKDPGGNEIDRIERSVHYAGPPVRAVLAKEASRLIANGKDVPEVAVRLTDMNGHPARFGIIGDFSVLPPYAPQTRIDELRDGLSQIDRTGTRFSVGRDGIARIRLQPTTQTGQVVLRLYLDGREQEIRAWMQPETREWVLVGLAEGTAGYHSASGNMEQLDASDVEADFYTDGRLAFFAKGKIKGSWLLTAAYDSSRDRKAEAVRLFQTIDPDTYYTLYGDATQQRYEAASVRKLYLKVERAQFYALFGDFETGLTVTELSRYNRRFNGLKSEYNGDFFGYSLFAADTDQAYVRDEIQGNGTSGLYRLSRRNLVVNSEKVTIQIRDRFRSDIILSTQILMRFVEYSIDYEAGTLFFKSPVYSRDEHFNPIVIVVEYESEDSADENYTYGGRGSLKFWNERVQVGATMIHESPKHAEADLGGLDAAVDLGGGLKARAEISATRRNEADTRISSTAYLAEVSQTSDRFDGRLYYRELGEGFGLGQQNGSEADTRKVGLDAAWRFKQAWTLGGQAYRYDYLATGTQRNLGEASVLYRDALYSLSAGLRVVEDRLGDGTDNRSTQLLAGISRLFYNNRLQMRLTHEQSLGGKDDSVDFPTRTIIGADFKLADALALFSEHEITQGETQDSQSSRVGFKSTPWTGGQIGSSLGRQTAENSARLFANLGLFQSWQIDARWSMDGGLDRSHTIRSENFAPFNPNVPTAAGATEDFTAVTFGLGYRAEWWSWTGRLESRWADSRDQWNLISGIAGEVRSGLGLSVGIKMLAADSADGSDDLDGDIRFSLALRPKNKAWIVLDRLDFKIKDRSDASGSHCSRRVINNFNANYKPHGRLQLALQYGAKYVFDTIDGDSYTGYTDLTGIEARYDLTARWDIGLLASVLHSWSAEQFDHRIGVSMGYSLIKNTWLSLGYNLTGFKDRDFSEAEFTARGPFVKFRIKLDQQTPRELVDWFSRKPQGQ